MANYYEDAEGGSNPGTEPSKPVEPDADSNVAELPKSILGGKEFKPGEEVVLQIVKVNEDSVVVKYASAEEEEPEEQPAPAEAAAPGGNEMASMME